MGSEVQAIASCIDHYSVEIERFVQYPQTIGLNYSVIGLSDEAGELLEKCSISPFSIDTNAVLGEVGDCWFYLCRVCHHSGVRPGAMWEDAALTPAPFDATLVGAASTVSIRSARILGRLKKVLRQDGGAEDKLRTAVLTEIPVIMLALNALGRAAGETIPRVLAMNDKKLSGRLKDGKIKGDGDSR